MRTVFLQSCNVKCSPAETNEDPQLSAGAGENPETNLGRGRNDKHCSLYVIVLCVKN